MSFFTQKYEYVYCDDLRGRDSIFHVPFSSAEQLVIVLIHIALLQILKAEIGSEKARGAVLQRDALIPSDAGRHIH